MKSSYFNRLIDQFIYGSTFASYLVAMMDAL